MTNSTKGAPGSRTGKRERARPAGGAVERTRPKAVSKRNPASGELGIVGARVDAVMKAAERSGLLGERTGRIAGRISPVLLAQARRQTGIAGDTDLIAFALASVALEDDFHRAFKAARGKVAADLKLGY